MIGSSKIEPEDLHRLARKCPNLEVVSLTANADVYKTDVMSFINNCKNLTKFHLKVTTQRQLKRYRADHIGKFKVTANWNEATNEGIILIEAPSN